MNVIDTRVRSPAAKKMTPVQKTIAIKPTNNRGEWLMRNKVWEELEKLKFSEQKIPKGAPSKRESKTPRVDIPLLFNLSSFAWKDTSTAREHTPVNTRSTPTIEAIQINISKMRKSPALIGPTGYSRDRTAYWSRKNAK